MNTRCASSPPEPSVQVNAAYPSIVRRLRHVTILVIVKLNLPTPLQTCRTMRDHLAIGERAMADDNPRVIVKVARLIVDIGECAILDVKVACAIGVQSSKRAGINPWFLAFMRQTSRTAAIRAAGPVNGIAKKVTVVDDATGASPKDRAVQLEIRHAKAAIMQQDNLSVTPPS